MNEGTNKFGKIHHFTVSLKDTFSDDKPPRERTFALLSLLLYANEGILETLEVIVVVPTNG